MLYFAYGSNMSIKRFKQRVTSATFVGQYILAEHRLKFHKIGKDYSGKCDAYLTGNQEDIVFGVVFNFDLKEKHQLDRAEDLGVGYQDKKVRLVNPEGKILEAYTYYAIKINPMLKPFSWYKEHVIAGARKARFPENYLNYIIDYPEIEDHNKDREKLELSIYQ